MTEQVIPMMINGGAPANLSGRRQSMRGAGLWPFFCRKTFEIRAFIFAFRFFSFFSKGKRKSADWPFIETVRKCGAIAAATLR